MKALLLRLLRGYRRHVSPCFPPSCRFLPTCSQYAIEAVERYGAIRGMWLAAKRLLRCNPLFKGGYDPVPELPRRGFKKE
jgi:putative membrane protein insertion efficiency factor